MPIYSRPNGLLNSFEITYKELKLGYYGLCVSVKLGFEITYKELKQLQIQLCDSSPYGFEITYKELKHFKECCTSIKELVLRLPIRN